MRFTITSLFALLLSGCYGCGVLQVCTPNAFGGSPPQGRRATEPLTVVTVHNAMSDARACSDGRCTPRHGLTLFLESTQDGCEALTPLALSLYGQQSGTMQGRIGNCPIEIEAAPNDEQLECILTITPYPSGDLQYSLYAYPYTETNCSYSVTPSGVTFTYNITGS
jgi:hypothetical protein